MPSCSIFFSMWMDRAVCLAMAGARERFDMGAAEDDASEEEEAARRRVRWVAADLIMVVRLADGWSGWC